MTEYVIKYIAENTGVLGRYDLLKGTLTMNSHVKLGRVYGVPVGLHWSWFLLFILLTWSLANGLFALQLPGYPAALHWGLAAITAILLFASVLAHEFGHAVVSIRNHIPVHQITLFLFGGVAQIEQEPQSPGVEFRIAVAGPLVSLGLALAFGLIGFAGSSLPVLPSAARWLAEINLTLVVFNLIPGFPLDGGRILRSAIWAWKRNYLKATRIASAVGQGVAFLFILTGIFFITRGNFSNGVWLAFIGWFLHNAAQSSRQYAEQHPLLADVRANQVMDRRIAEVPADMTVCELMTTRVLYGGKRSFIVAGDHRPLGMVTIRDIVTLPREDWEFTRVREVMVPWERLVRVTPNSGVGNVLAMMENTNVRLVPVVLGNQVEGTLSREQILRHLRQHIHTQDA